MTYTIAEPCIDVKDKACVEECPVDCIYEGDRMLYIHPTECIDCGACEPVCPVEAIFYEDDVPAEWAVQADQRRVLQRRARAQGLARWRGGRRRVRGRPPQGRGLGGLSLRPI
jgi:NAD-dependent dihydropyrimidine dehydrogenase PreA subunit